MSQNDYIILRDEDGKAYIAHAGLLDNARNAIRGAANSISATAQQVANKAKGVGRGVRQNHKYILKVNENGKTRYFYKQEEVKAYYEAKKRGIKNAAEYAQNAVKDKTSGVVDAVKNTVREATGYAAKDRMNAAAAKRSELNDAQNQKHEAWTQAKKAKDQADVKTFQATIESEMANEKAKKSNVFNRKQRETDAKTASDQQKQYAAKSHEAGVNEQKARRELDRAIAAYNKNAGEEYDNQRIYENSLAGRVDRTTAAASSAFSKAKGATNNAVSNAKNAYERMKSEFRDKANEAKNDIRELTGQAARDRMDEAANRRDQAAMEHKNIREQRAEQKERLENLNKEYENLNKDFSEASNRVSEESQSRNPFGRQKRVQAAKDEAYKALDKLENNNRAYEREYDKYSDLEEKRKQTLDKAMDANLDYQASKKVYENSLAGRVDRAAANTREATKNTVSSAQDMIDRARVAVKDKSEDLSAKAKSTVQSARDSVKGMIDNARSSTAKAVNEAWDKIPKNSDGTVNPFDKNFQSTYNDWKTKKDKYDSSLAGRAKDAAEKATDSVKDMINQAKKFKKNRDGSAEQGFKDVVDFINIAGQYRREAEARGRGDITNTIAGHTQSYSVLPPRDSQWRKDQEHADELATKINRTVNDYINGDLSLDDAKQKVENYKSELDSIDFEQYNDRKVRTPSKADATGRARARQFGSDTVSVPNSENTRATKSSYTKKPDPVNSSGARPYETMKRDAREAGVDFDSYDKAVSDAEKLAKRLMKEYREANESPGPKSLVGKMWYDDPEYKRAIERRKTEEEKLVKQLYQ